MRENEKMTSFVEASKEEKETPAVHTGSAGNPSSEKAEGAVKKIEAFQRFGSILGLERMTELLDLLGNPQDQLKVIHVAGTNGKGSICRYIYCCLQAAGYKTGLYISPFIERFHERIEVGGSYIQDEELAAYTDRVLAQVQVMTDAGKDSPTEFEVITAIALLYFKEQNCDYVVLEVGLGGRGDSTNVCKEPLVSVIASISYDHMDRLGNTLTEIAGEKAGIIKPGCPVVTSAEAEEALQVIRRKADECGTICVETRQIPYRIKEEGLWGCRFDVALRGRTFENLQISMAGEHQVKNAIAALTALLLLEENKKITLTEDALYSGFAAAKQPGRLETLTEEGEKPVILLDGAHNEDGARVLRQALEAFCQNKKILMVVGILADKEVDQILREFLRITGNFIVTEPDSPRRMKADLLADRIRKQGGVCQTAETYSQACQMALQQGEDYDLILFAGSLYLIGAVRRILREMRCGDDKI